jgi:Zn-dependent peptidase ImmA (M78 family)
VSWSRYLQLKRRWGVSLAALVRRARDVGVISDHAYYRANVHISAVGWRQREPGGRDQAEKPTVLSRALRLMQDDLGMSAESILALLRMGPDKGQEFWEGVAQAA